MLGTAPTYILAWGGGAGGCSRPCCPPARFYHPVDDRLYTIYQSMVLFYFEYYTGVQQRSPQGRLRWA
uniref:Uncharacterized protein n=1 Tax=Pseudonaja textilis TaxID=8673 RepID=A0A670YWQ8_PSETE